MKFSPYFKISQKVSQNSLKILGFLSRLRLYLFFVFLFCFVLFGRITWDFESQRADCILPERMKKKKNWSKRSFTMWGHTKLILCFTDPPTLFLSQTRKILKLCSSASASNLRARLCGYHYVVLLVESITTWPRSRMAASFVVVTTVCLWHSGVNYHVAMVKDGSFFHCRNNGLLVARASIYLLFPWGSRSFLGCQLSLVF